MQDVVKAQLWLLSSSYISEVRKLPVYCTAKSVNKFEGSMLYLDARLKPLCCRRWSLYTLKCGGWWYCCAKLDKVETPLEVWTVDRKDVWREDIDDLLWGKRREVERMQVESRRHFLWLVDGMGEGFCWGEVFLKEDEGEAISLGSKPNERGQVGRAV